MNKQRALSVLKWSAPVIALIEVSLVVSGAMTLKTAAVVIVVLEMVLGLVALALAGVAVSAFRQSRQSGTPWAQALAGAAQQVIPRPMFALMRQEIGVFTALWMGITHRASLTPGYRPLFYAKDQRAMFVALIVLSLIEIPSVHLIFGWRWYTVLLTALGADSIIWMAGFFLSFRRRPHLVSDERIILRAGHLGRLELPRDAVVGVRTKHQGDYQRTVMVDADTVSLALMGATNLAFTLKPGTVVRINNERDVEAREVRFAADDAAEVRRLCLAAG